MQLRLEVDEEGADTERLSALVGYLRAELLQLDIDDAVRLPGGEAPPGSRAVNVSAAASLLVTLGQSVQNLRSVVATISAWLGRGAGNPRIVRLEIDGDKIELSQASDAEQEQLVALFVGRHSV
jgi:hypothetical protein